MADPEVLELLEMWNLSELESKFQSEKIKLQTLNFLEPYSKTTEQLVPEIGLRAIFDAKLDNYKKKHQQKRVSLNIDARNDSDSDQDSDIIVPEDKMKDNTNVINAHLDSLNVRELLKTSPSGVAVLAWFEQKKFLRTNDFNILLTMVADYMLKPLICDDPPKFIYDYSVKHIDMVSDKIIVSFPNLEKGIFYMPPRTISPKQIYPRGKLYNFLGKRVVYYRKLNLIIKPQKTIQHSNKRRKLNEDSSDTGENAKTSLQWLKENPCTSDWFEVSYHWDESRSLRLQELDSLVENNISKVFETFKVLAQPQGFELLLSDYDFDQSLQNTDNLQINWPEFSKNLEGLLKKRLKAPLYVELLSYIGTEECTNNTRNLILLYLLPAICVPLAKVAVSNNKNGWKPSKSESIKTFMLHVMLPTDVNKALKKRKQFFKKKGLSFQPTIIVAGPTMKEIQEIFVVIDNQKYLMNDILHALDTCYKIIHVLNLEYAHAALPSWLLIQRLIYKHKAPTDECLGQLQTLEGELNDISAELEINARRQENAD